MRCNQITLLLFVSVCIGISICLCATSAAAQEEAANTEPAPELAPVALDQASETAVQNPFDSPVADDEEQPVETVANSPIAEVEPAIEEMAQPPAHLDSNHFIVRQAGNWANFQQDVQIWGSRNVASAEELEATLMGLASYDGARLAKGWMATNVLITLQVPEFVAGVREWEAQYGRDVLLERLHANQMFATMIPGAEQAGNAMLRAAKSDGQRVQMVGSLYKDQAYSLQKQSWANRKQSGKSIRLAALRTASNYPRALRSDLLEKLAAPGRTSMEQPYDPDAAKGSFLSALKLGPRSAFAAPNQQNMPQTDLAPGRDITRANVLAMAMLLILKEKPDHSSFGKWIDDVELRECVDWSKVHLNQCVAAGHFVFESSFCIAEHQLIDIGQCVGDVVAGSSNSSTTHH